jgi:hypothetical protein
MAFLCEICSLATHMPTQSVCEPDAPVLYDISSRSRMGKISVTQVPNLDPALVHTYRTSGGGGQRFMHPSDRPAGGGEPSSQAFRTSRMLGAWVELG